MEPQEQPTNQDQDKKVILLNKLKIPMIVVVLVLVFLGGVVILKNSFFKKNENQAARHVFNLPSVDPAKDLKDMQSLRSRYAFPAFEYIKSQVKPSLPDYTIKLEEIANLANFGDKLSEQQFLKPIIFSDSQKQALEKNNFFVALNNDNFFNPDAQSDSSRVDDWTDLYRSIRGIADPQYRRPENSVFISSDFALHLYHRLLDKEFKYVEQTGFYPRLKNISEQMLNKSIEGYNTAADNQQKDSYQRLITYFAVPAALLDSASTFYDQSLVVDDKSDSKEAVMANLKKWQAKIPASAYDLAKQELELVMDAKDITNSPLFGPYLREQQLEFSEDYTQYGPRSHYGENPILRSYWRSMMWYGRQSFMAKSPKLTRDAINLVALVNQPDLIKNWEDIYVPTSFFVGESDDLGIYEYQQALDGYKDKVVSDQLVSKLQTDVKNMKNPQIMSSVAVGDQVIDSSKEELQNKTKGFRFMGQRFTPDAFIFSSLTQGDEQPDPKTGEKLPSMPTALMVANLMGSQTAKPLLDDWINKNAPDSKNVLADRMNSLNQYFGSLSIDLWTQNIYWSWLYTLKSLFQENLDKTGYPNFMKTQDWNNKNLTAMLGSWTELKHDTLLYAKQSYAEMGGGGDEGEIPPVPKGYVEPNIEFWDRLIPLAKMTKAGLEQRGLLDQEFQGRNEKLIEALEYFRQISISELKNEKISDEEFENLRIKAGNLDSIILPLPNEQRTEDLARAALIADVHTDASKGKILYEADGIPNYIYVAVKDNNGTRLTKGLVYSYYEFINPLEKRLTDSDWKEWVYTRDSSRMPQLPQWSQSLIR